MLQSLLSGRTLRIALVVSVLFALCSLLYFQHVKRSSLEATEKTKRFLQTLENSKKTSNPNVQEVDSPEQEVTDARPDPIDETDSLETESLSIDEAAEFAAGADALLPEALSDTKDASPSSYGVSPFGFGPYPEVPIGFPENLMPAWTWSEEKREEHAGGLINFELMGRVLVKLWNQGEQGFVGVVRANEDGKVYPIYPNVMYVRKWKETPIIRDGEFVGFVKYPRGTISGPGVPDLDPIDYHRGTVPDDIRYLDRATAGINPYEFLELEFK